MFGNSARTSNETPHPAITKVSWLMLFKEIIALYTENRTMLIDTKSVFLKEGFKMSLFCRLSGLRRSTYLIRCIWHSVRSLVWGTEPLQNIYLMMTVFRNLAAFTPVEIYRRFRGSYCLCYVDQALNTSETWIYNYQISRRYIPEDSHFHTCHSPSSSVPLYLRTFKYSPICV
jgi:hypothetical protein